MSDGKLQLRFEALQQQNRNLKGELSKVQHDLVSVESRLEVLQREKEYYQAISNTFERNIESTVESLCESWESLRQAKIEISDLESRLKMADDKVARAYAILGEQRSVIRGPITSEYNKS